MTLEPCEACGTAPDHNPNDGICAYRRSLAVQEAQREQDIRDEIAKIRQEQLCDIEDAERRRAQEELRKLMID